MGSSQNSYDLWKNDPFRTITKYSHVYKDENIDDDYDDDEENTNITLGAIDWDLDFRTMNENNVYSFNLDCLNRSPLWKCDVELEAKFKNGLESKIVKAEQHFSSSLNQLKIEAKFEREAKNASVDIKIKVKNVEGIRYLEKFDLLKEVPELGDVVIVINEKKLTANKEYLAHCSPFFERLFFGDFCEKNQQEVQLDDVDFEEFVDLMNVISPERKEIKDENVEYILKLATRFDMQPIIDQCETFLRDIVIIESYKDPVEKLLLAEKYSLIHLHHEYTRILHKRCLQYYGECERFDELSDTTKAAILDASWHFLMKEKD